MDGEWRYSYFNVVVNFIFIVLRFISRLRSRLDRIYVYSLWLNLMEMLGLKLGNLAKLVLCGIDPTYRRYYLLRPCSLACINGFLVCNRTRFGTKTYMILHSRKTPTSFWRRCRGTSVKSLIFLLWFNT